MAEEICEKISNAAAVCVRKTFSVCRIFGKAGKLIKKGVESAVFSAKRLKAKLVNLKKKVRAESHYAATDEKQKTVFSELGKEVFYKAEEKKKNVFSARPVKDLLEKAQDYEHYKKEIREGINTQKRRMDEIAIFSRAVAELSHSDPRVRRVAVRVLKRLDNKDAVPYLTKSLHDPDPVVRERAREVLHLLINKVKNPKSGGRK